MSISCLVDTCWFFPSLIYINQQFCQHSNYPLLISPVEVKVKCFDFRERHVFGRQTTSFNYLVVLGTNSHVESGKKISKSVIQFGLIIIIKLIIKYECKTKEKSSKFVEWIAESATVRETDWINEHWANLRTLWHSNLFCYINKLEIRNSTSFFGTQR